MTWQQKSAAVEECTVDSADEFISLLRRSNDEWWETGRCAWVFRGQADSEWPILPTAWRSGNQIIKGAREVMARRLETCTDPQTLRWNTGSWISGEAIFGPNDRAVAHRLAIEAAAEALLIYDFALSADRHGIDLPISGELPQDPADEGWVHAPTEPILADELLRWSQLPQLLALAQHYGIPTRLVDWTMDPIAAAFFAVTDAAVPKNGGVAVYALNVDRSRTVRGPAARFPEIFANAGPDHDGIDISPSIRVVRPARVANPNMTAQAGLFTCIEASGVDYMRREGRRPGLQEFLDEAAPDAVVLRRIVLPAAHAPSVAELLRREQVTISRLMPSLENVADDVLTTWSSPATEAV